MVIVSLQSVGNLFHNATIAGKKLKRYAPTRTGGTKNLMLWPCTSVTSIPLYVWLKWYCNQSVKYPVDHSTITLESTFFQ